MIFFNGGLIVEIKINFANELLSIIFFEKLLYISKIFTKFEVKLYILKIFTFLLFSHYKVERNK